MGRSRRRPGRTRASSTASSAAPSASSGDSKAGTGTTPVEAVDLGARVTQAPRAPGCYTFVDAGGRALYVGKAVDLRARLRSHLGDRDPRRLRMVRETADISWILCASEAEALVVEARRVRELQPRYNVRLREADPYPYLAVATSRLGPERVTVARGPARPKVRRFGPWPDRSVLDALVTVAQEVYGLRSCSDGTFRRAQAQNRACFLADVGRCSAPCVDAAAAAAHPAKVAALARLARGQIAAARRDVSVLMADAAETRRYERAARLRDLRARLESLADAWRVQGLAGANVDAVGCSASGALRAVTWVQVRHGAIVAVRSLVDESSRDDPELIALALAAEAEADERPVPALVAEVPPTLAGCALGTGGQLQAARTRAQRGLVALAVENATAAASRASGERDADPARRAAALAALGSACRIAPPWRIEAFDISHTGGRSPRASMVVMEDGLPVRREYRTYRVSAGGDDYRAMREAVTARYRRLARGLGPRPDLIVIDGGPGQLAEARAALAELGLGELVTVSLAKRDEELWLDAETVVRLERTDPALHVAQRVRDEAHRHGRTAHRRARARDIDADGLPPVPGLGPARLRALRQALSPAEIAAADVATLTKAGLPRPVAERLVTALEERPST